jgi:Zn-dependent peptidase ImmA (M78 family)
MHDACEADLRLDPVVEAERIFKKYWSEGVFPVDPVTICRRVGLRVLDTALPQNVSGALIKEEGKEPMVVLHYADHSNRKRFTCAHELGHFVKRTSSSSSEDLKMYKYIDFRSDTKGPDEFFANKFAASLLMPESEVKRSWKSGGHIIDFASRFGVSVEAARIRLSELGLSS